MRGHRHLLTGALLGLLLASSHAGAEETRGILDMERERITTMSERLGLPAATREKMVHILVAHDRQRGEHLRNLAEHLRTLEASYKDGQVLSPDAAATLAMVEADLEGLRDVARRKRSALEEQLTPVQKVQFLARLPEGAGFDPSQGKRPGRALGLVRRLLGISEETYTALSDLVEARGPVRQELRKGWKSLRSEARQAAASEGLTPEKAETVMNRAHALKEKVQQRMDEGLEALRSTLNASQRAELVVKVYRAFKKVSSILERLASLDEVKLFR